jgi:hypothetical protein
MMSRAGKLLEQVKPDLSALDRMSDDELGDAYDYYASMSEPDPENADQYASDLARIKTEMKKRGWTIPGEE